MESNAKQLYLALQERLADRIPEIKYIDLNLGQLQAGIRPAVSYPAVLIDFDARAREICGSHIMMDADVTLLVISDTYSQSNHLAPLDVRMKALEYMDLSARITGVLAGYQPECLSRELEFQGCRSVNTAEYRVCQLTFSTTWFTEIAES